MKYVKRLKVFQELFLPSFFSCLNIFWYSFLSPVRTLFVFYYFKVSSRVKNHHFSKFSIFRWLSRAHQELSFKKNSRKKCFFCANLWSAKVFSILIILIDRWQVLSYLIRTQLLNQANHTIWQKSWSTSIVLTVFPGVWKWMPPKKKKELVRFRPWLQDERRRQNRFAKCGLRN